MSQLGISRASRSLSTSTGGLGAPSGQPGIVSSTFTSLRSLVGFSRAARGPRPAPARSGPRPARSKVTAAPAVRPPSRSPSPVIHPAHRCSNVSARSPMYSLDLFDRLAETAEFRRLPQLIDLLHDLDCVVGEVWRRFMRTIAEVAVRASCGSAASQLLQPRGLGPPSATLELLIQRSELGQGFLVRAGLVLVGRQFQQTLQQLVGLGLFARRVEQRVLDRAPARRLVQIEQVAGSVAAVSDRSSRPACRASGEYGGDADVAVQPAQQLYRPASQAVLDAWPRSCRRST